MTIIDISLLQTVPLANLNRDDLGAPKTLVYGGTTRTRVSSQCWKRQVRHEVEDRLADPTVRTRRITTTVTHRLEELGWSAEEARAAGDQVALSAGKGIKLEKDGATSVLLYLPIASIDELVQLAVEHRDEITAAAARKKPTAVLPGDRITEILAGRNGTISLFGRMLAELPSTEVDGAVQVAHAFTVHETAPEVDFFTAVDDLNSAFERGSGHMNSAEFAAGVFYRYACIDVDGLLRNVNGDKKIAAELSDEFLTAFISTLPTGKKTATAPNTLPELAYVTVRADRPVSLAGAFERGLTGSNGYAQEARTKLASYAGRLNALWGKEHIGFEGYAGIDENDLTGLGGRVDSYRELVESAVAVAYRENA